MSNPDASGKNCGLCIRWRRLRDKAFVGRCLNPANDGAFTNHQASCPCFEAVRAKPGKAQVGAVPATGY
jgi:hypothetical protein